MTETAINNCRMDFLKGNGGSLLAAWSGIKNATKVNKIFDPSSCLTKGDFEQAGLLGLSEAFKSYDHSKGMQLRTWSIRICNQHIIREFAEFSTPFYPLSKLILNASPDDSGMHKLDSLFLKIASNYEPSFITEDFYNLVISKVLKNLYNINRKIHSFFKFRIENPDLDDSAIMNMLDISTVYCKYKKIIKEELYKILNELEYEGFNNSR